MGWPQGMMRGLEDRKHDGKPRESQRMMANVDSTLRETLFIPDDRDPDGHICGNVVALSGKTWEICCERGGGAGRPHSSNL